MARNMFEDIKPISRTGDAGKSAPKPVPAKEERFVPKKPKPIPVVRQTPVYEPLPREIPFTPEPPKQASMHALWYIAALAIIAFFFSLSFLFENATVTIVPKSVPIALDNTDAFSADKDSTDPTAITYTEMTLAGDQSINLPSTQTQTLSNPATGTVVLYNAYSTSAYKLTKSTRLETPDGRIYHIDTAATIPGYTGKGASLVPGSVDATVTAAVPGEAGNLDQSDFTVPGLAGTAQATTIYARSKSAFTGGISGTVYTIPQSDADAAEGTLSDKLKASLIAKAKVQVPDGYLFYDTATDFEPDQAVEVPYSKTTEVPIALHGTLTAYLIKEDTLVHAIAQKFVSQYAGEAVTVPTLQSFVLTPSAPMDPANDTSFAFTFTGTGSVVWTVDPAAIQTLLVGQKKSDFETLMGQVVGVDKADVDIKPFWKQSFPTDIKRITVTLQNPDQ